jgi:hypothetical protein
MNFYFHINQNWIRVVNQKKLGSHFKLGSQKKKLIQNVYQQSFHSHSHPVHKNFQSGSPGICDRPTIHCWALENSFFAYFTLI